jgi:hypothetical protein
LKSVAREITASKSKQFMIELQNVVEVAQELARIKQQTELNPMQSRHCTNTQSAIWSSDLQRIIGAPSRNKQHHRIDQIERQEAKLKEYQRKENMERSMQRRRAQHEINTFWRSTYKKYGFELSVETQIVNALDSIKNALLRHDNIYNNKQQQNNNNQNNREKCLQNSRKEEKQEQKSASYLSNSVSKWDEFLFEYRPTENETAQAANTVNYTWKAPYQHQQQEPIATESCVVSFSVGRYSNKNSSDNTTASSSLSSTDSITTATPAASQNAIVAPWLHEDATSVHSHQLAPHVAMKWWPMRRRNMTALKSKTNPNAEMTSAPMDDDALRACEIEAASARAAYE